MKKEPYESPRLEVAELKLEESIASSSVTPANGSQGYNIKESWEDESLEDINIDWE